PPEQLRGARQADHKSDQYALGVVLYECVVGQRPFEAENIYAMLRAIGDGDYPLPRVLRPDLPEELELVIVRSMRLDPAQRYPTTRHFGAALLPFASAQARVLWTDTFRVAGEDGSFDPGLPVGMTLALPPDGAGSPSAPSGGFRHRAGSSPSAGGTRIL